MNIADGTIGGMSHATLSEWANYNTFKPAVSRFCAILAARTGLVAHVDNNALLAAHTGWVQECSYWLNSHVMPPGTQSLSHFKQLGILLHHLSNSGFVAFTLRRRGTESDPLDNIYGRIDFAADEDRQWFLDGQDAYAAWLFVSNTVVGYERDRSDRSDRFCYKITSAFEFDMVSMLLSSRHTSEALYLIIKALFLRD